MRLKPAVPCTHPAGEPWNRFRRWLAVVVIFCGACTHNRSSTSPQEPTRQAPEAPHLVVETKADGYQFDAELQGTLVQLEGCIRVQSRLHKTIYTPIWSHGTTLSSDARTIQVRLFGELIARLPLGTTIHSNGGFIPETQAKKLADLGSCPGPYWLMGHEIDSEPELGKTAAKR